MIISTIPFHLYHTTSSGPSAAEASTILEIARQRMIDWLARIQSPLLRWKRRISIVVGPKLGNVHVRETWTL